MKSSVAVQIFGIVLLMFISLSGCNHVASPAKPNAVTDITNGVWRLVEIQRVGGSETDVAPDPLYTIQFGADGRVSGQAHCNRHTGQYELRPSGSITMTGGASTRMMCLGESIADEFLKTLGTVTRYEMSDGKLILTSNDGAKMTFTNEQ